MDQTHPTPREWAATSGSNFSHQRPPEHSQAKNLWVDPPTIKGSSKD